jgi:natural product biosynthesis luciferase-like monooxygenase protein
MEFSLMFFASSQQYTAAEEYDLVMRATRFADEHGFCAVWTPERHFHEFGGLFPNPSVLSAALAVITQRIQIRAGSLISPLHNTIRIAEDWAVIDNLSSGRAAVSFGSGWNVNDFVLWPERYASRQAEMFEQIKLIQELWSGKVVTRINSQGNPVAISLSPSPIQETLPVWITSSGNVETFIRAGRMGANVLTHLMAQDVPTLAAKIDAYRSAREEAGFDPWTGIVTLMLHTFTGTDLDEVRDKVKKPFREYMRSAISLEKEAALRGGAISCGHKPPSASVVDDSLDEMVDIAFERYFHHSSLMGTVETCSGLLTRLQEIGVSEIACLIDFGVDRESVLEGLVVLDLLRQKFADHSREKTEFLIEEFTAVLE